MKTITYDDTLYQLVPKETDRAMDDAAEQYYINTKNKMKGQWWWNRLYQSYLSAAPTPPAQPKQPPGIHNCTFSNEPVQTGVVVVGESTQTPAQPAIPESLWRSILDAGLTLHKEGGKLWVEKAVQPAEKWEKKLRVEIDHAIMNDLRLSPKLGRTTGEPAVRISDIEAVIDCMVHAQQTAQPAERKPPIPDKEYHAGDGLIFDGQKWLEVAPSMETFAMLNMAKGFDISGKKAERKPQEWLDIETAPKDGTEVIVWRDDCGQFIASYTCPANFPLTQNEIDQTPEDVLFAYDWFTQWPHGYRCDGSETPTHWIPLPAPPETGIKRES